MFSQDVSIDTAAAGLALIGSPDLPAPPALAGATFQYTAATHTAQWTFADPLAVDKYLLEIPSAAVTNSLGLGLDGEFTNATGSSAGGSFPSGDGAAGGDFSFRFNVLPGDVDGNGAVTGADGNIVRGLLLQNTESAAYSPLADLNADGSITGLDGAAVRLNLLLSLPATDPTADVGGGNQPTTAPTGGSGSAAAVAVANPVTISIGQSLVPAVAMAAPAPLASAAVIVASAADPTAPAAAFVAPTPTRLPRQRRPGSLMMRRLRRSPMQILAVSMRGMFPRAPRRFRNRTRQRRPLRMRPPASHRPGNRPALRRSFQAAASPRSNRLARRSRRRATCMPSCTIW